MRNRLLLLLTLTLLMLNGCNKAGSKASAPGAIATATPIAYSISGKVMTPLGPVPTATVKLSSFTDEGCIELGKKQNHTIEEKSKYEKCQKHLAEVQTNEKGEYGFANLEAGWYRLFIRWRATLKSGVQSGADLSGEYWMYYGHPKDEPDKFGFAAIGYPFKLAGGEKVTKDLFYNKGPYASGKK